MGTKAAAKKMFTHYLNEIGQEETEHYTDEDNQMIMCTKIEKMCRNMWNFALGFKDKVKADDGTEINVTHAPDRGMMVILYDRLEGKAAPTRDVSTGKRVTAADKVTEQTKKRIEAGGK